MPRKAKYVSMDKNKRFRVTVELCEDSAPSIDRMLSIMNASGKPVSISQLMRVAIVHFEATGDWSKARHSSPTKLRKPEC